MADIRIKDLATTATTTASDDFMAVDGVTNGTRKLSAATPAFLTSVTTPSLTSPAATNLTLAGGAGNSSIILTPAGTGNVGIGTVSPTAKITIADVSKAVGTRGNLYIYSTDSMAVDKGGEITLGGSYNGTDETIFGGLAARKENGTANDTASYMTFATNSAALGLREVVRIASTGNVSILSTTAGSSGAGALVVAGGLSAAGASYFGGQVTGARPFMSTGAIQANMTSAGGFGFSGGGTNFYSFGANSATSGSFAFQSVSSDASVNFNALTLAAGTGAATFAGAVTVTGDTSIGTNVFKIDTTNARILLGLAAALQGDTLEIAAKGDGGAISLFGRAGGANESSIRFRANGAPTLKAFIQGSDAGLLLGTGSTTRLSIAASTGDVTISSTTAGSSGAGALVVAGGLATGAASYIGGALTLAGTGLSATNASGSVEFSGSRSSTGGGVTVTYKTGATTNWFHGLRGLVDNNWYLFNDGTSTNTLIFNYSTNAATFAGLIFPQQAVTASAPTYVKGAIYFDTTLNKLRVGGATGWETITSV